MQKGLIISNISNLYEVKVEDKIIECKPMGKIKQTELTPVVGDYVEIQEIENEQGKGMITKVLKRTMYSKRPKLANLTQIVLVVSLKSPKPYLKITPIICINKVDLGNEELLKNIHEVYEKIGYKVIDTIAKQGKGIDELRKVLKNNITAFSGNSGVGKSTLINSLFSETKTLEGDISKKNNKGKNTTTSVTLYEIENGYIADTPGFSTFTIEEIESEELSYYFKEFKEYLPKCEYTDCEHIKEQNCGIKSAVEAEKISKERYERYCKIMEELKKKEERKW